MVSPAGTNTANFNNCANWNNQSGNLTTVGLNGGPSAYGTYDQAGSVAEWTSDGWLLGGSYSSSVNELGLPSGLLRGSLGDSSSTSGFRITGEDHTHINVSFDGPDFYIPSQQLNHSFTIINDEQFTISMDIDCPLDSKITTNSWSVSYGPGSSGIVSGTGNPSGLISLGPLSTATFNMISNTDSLAKTSIVIAASLSLTTQTAPLINSIFYNTIPVSFQKSPVPSLYSILVDGSGWNPVAPNEFLLIDDANNAPTASGKGSVGYNYLMTKYEITNLEYCKFLNSIDPQGIQPNGLWDSYNREYYDYLMLGGILYNSFASNGSKYTTRAEMSNKPVNLVSWWAAARYCNWLHNGGIAYSTTQTGNTAPQNSGAYTLGENTTGAMPLPNAGAKYRIPTSNEWIKAAYYLRGSTSAGYSTFATRSSTAPSGVSANEAGDGVSTIYNNSVNCFNQAIWNPEGYNEWWHGQQPRPTTVGTNGTPSSYGLFDMNGNVEEITEGSDRNYFYPRGRAYDSTSLTGINTDNLPESGIALETHAVSWNTGFRIISLFEGDITVSSSVSDAYYTQNKEITVSLILNNQSIYNIDYATLDMNISGPEFESIDWLATYPSTSSGPIRGHSSFTSNMSIGAGDSITFIVKLVTKNNTVAPILLSALVTPPELFSDINLTNNITTITIPPKPTDVSISISGPPFYEQSEPANYNLVINNIGDSYIEDATVLFSYSGGIIAALDWSASHNLSIGEMSGANILYTNIALLPSGQTTYNIQLTPSATTINNILLSASIVAPSSLPDPNLSNNIVSLSTPVKPTDLGINITSLGEYYTQNIIFPIIVQITNTGQYSPDTIFNIAFSGSSNDTAISWTAIYSSGSSGPMSGVGNPSNSGINLANGGSCELNISYIPGVNSLVPIQVIASVGSKSPLIDNNINNNTSLSSLVFLSPTDISISGSLGSRPYYINNEYIDYSFTVTNNGPNAISDISVSIPSSSGLISTKWTAAYTNGSGPGFGSGDINSYIYLASGGSAKYTIDGTAAPGMTSPILSTGTVSLPNISGLMDPDESNNISTVSVPRALSIGNVLYSQSTCDDDGYITINLNDGVPPFRYTIGSVFANSSERTYKFTGLKSGTYNIVVIDSTSYTSSYSEEIVIEDSTISLSINNALPPVLLDSFGKLDFTISGDGPFSLVFSNTTNEETIEIPAFETKYLVDITGNKYNYIIDDKITPGTYSLMIIGSNNCRLLETFIMPNITPMSVSVSSSPDEPIIINSPLISLDIFDTLLVPYKHILHNSDLWSLIKEFNIKDNIYLWINNDRYEFRVVRTMLDKYCLNENKIEILKLGNSYEDWYFYLYIAPSINLSSNPELINAKIRLGTADETQMYDIVLGLSEDGRLEQEAPSLIKGSIIVDGVSFPDIVNGSSANISIGVNELGLGSNDYELLNIKKTQFSRMYSAGAVTAINFLENFNVLNEYVGLSQTSCNTNETDYQYLIRIKNLLITINNFNNLNTIYLFNNNNIIHTGQINCFPSIHSPMITDKGSIDNNFNIQYFTFNINDKHIHKFISNNKKVENVTVMNGLDSRYVIARTTDNYGNIPKSIVYDNIIVSYDSHFIKSKQIIQNINADILHDFTYGDILIFVPTPEENDLPNPNPTPPVIPVTPTTPVITIPTVEVTKDVTNTSSLTVNIFPLNTKCIIYGPHQYMHTFSGNTKFTNIIPGIYRIIGEPTDIKNKNLYQNEYRIIINKNTAVSQNVEFFSYANMIFISKEDH
jgi:sulfatase modifying factor 1